MNLFPDDPQKQAMMMMALGLLGGAPGQRKNFGADLAHGGLLGMQGLQSAQSMQMKRKEAEERDQLRQMQIEQARLAQSQAQQRQQAIGQLAQQHPQLAPLFTVAPDKAVDRAFPTPQMAFAPNGQAVDMKALQPGQDFAKQPEWKDPAYQEFMLKKAREGASRVNVDTRQETEFAKSLGKQQGEDYAGLMKSDAMASSKLNKLGRLESLLASSGNTGKLTPATMELKAAAESLGFKVDPKLPFQQAAQALSNEIALELRNPSGGAGMPGALSDRDREFLVNMVPNLGKTPEGNKMLIGTMKKLAQREKDIAKLAREYRQKTGRFDEGFYQVLSDYSAKNPLFPQKDEEQGWSVTRLP